MEKSAYLRSAIESLQREIDAATSRVEAERAYIARLNVTLEDLRAASERSLPSGTARAPGGPTRQRPRTTSLVRDLLKSEPHNHMGVPYIVSRLSEAGRLGHLKQPYNTVLEAAKRLAERDDFIYRVDGDDGTFFVYSEDEPEYDADGNVRPFEALPPDDPRRPATRRQA